MWWQLRCSRLQQARKYGLLNNVFALTWICLMPLSSFAGYVDDDSIQPRLRPVHWRFLDQDSPAKYGSSIFLSSAMLRNINSNPMPRYKNASQKSHHQNMHDEFSTSMHHQEIASSNMTKDRRQQSRVKREEGAQTALSENVTMILEDLLNNYDKTERPSFKHGHATKVKINILIRSMGPISEEDMNYSMDCYFRQYWRDTRLSFTGLKSNTHSEKIDQLSLNVKMLEKIWKPDTYFHNGLSSYLHTITRPNKLLRISEHGDITYSMRLTIKAKCPMMLRSFPMDWQSCPLVIGSFAYSADEVIYVWKPPANNSVDYEGKLQLSQFDIKDTAFRALNYSRGNNMGTYSVLQVVIALQRHTGYFLIQIYLPCTLLVVLSWVGFWLNREATSDRVGLGITTVLTLSTISLDSRTDLPKVHYATALDWFIICCFGYCSATLLQFAGVHYFTKIGSGEVFSITEDKAELLKDDLPNPADANDDDDEWQDVEESEEWGPQTPMTPLNDDSDDGMLCTSRQQVIDQRYPVVAQQPLPLPPPPPPPRCSHNQYGQYDMGLSFNHNADYIDDQCDSLSDDCTECAQIAAANAVAAASMHTRCKVPPNCMDIPRAPINGRGQQATPPPPPRPSQQQLLRCHGGNLANNYQRSTSAPAPTTSTPGLPNSYSVVSGIMRTSLVSQQWKGQNDRSQNAVVRQAQTQTETKLSCFRQFLYCLFANEKYRRARLLEATRQGSTNSTSKIDAVARILFPASFGLFNIMYWLSYFHPQKPFEWTDHMLKGNTL